MRSARRPLAALGLLAAVVSMLSVSCGVPAAAQRLEPVAAGPVNRAVTLEPQTAGERSAQSLLKDPKMLLEVPEDFREFGGARAGQIVETKSLTLRFAAAATLTKIESTPDFKLEQGGSCVEEYSYAANSTCTLLVRFTPQGPGRRVAKLAITNSADATPLAVGLGGYGSSPMISFTASLITTVPQTVSGGAGILLGA